MTTDVIKNTRLRNAPKTGGAFYGKFAGRGARKARAESGRHTAAPGGSAADAFDPERDGWRRSMSNMVALLEYAHRLIEAAEAHIVEQEERIGKLESITVTDELTGITNRRGLYDAFMAELDRCNRGQSIGGLLVLIDLDNFKMINDVHGHMAGDASLRLVARTLSGLVRPMDTVARLGGDEFVILLSNTTRENAAVRAQTLAWQLNNLALAWYGEEIPVRASLGLKNFGKGDNADKIFNAADVELYAAKSFRSRKRAHDASPTDAENHHDTTPNNGEFNNAIAHQNQLGTGATPQG